MKTWVTSDSHFGHWGVTKFLNKDGTKLRPWDNIYDMDEALIQNWNECVKPEDKVYHLGDVIINRRAFKTLEKLNGNRKILIKGNHCIFKIEEYLRHFADVRSYQIYPAHNIIMSHIPVHESQLEQRWKLNVHGHLHSNNVLDQFGNNDLRYLNVCVEQTNFRPIELDEIIAYKEKHFG